MKITRYLVAGAAAATLAGGAFAFAANLDVDSETLASGSDSTNNACDVLNVEYTTSYSNLVYNLDTIVLDGGAGCADHDYKVMVDNESVADVELIGELDENGEYTIDLIDEVVDADPTIDANEVMNITAVLTGVDSDA